MAISLDKLISKDTIQKFTIYERLLREWNRRTALVQEDTLSNFQYRHVIDSLQIIPIIQSLPSPQENYFRELDVGKCNKLNIVGQSIQDPLSRKILLDDASNADRALSIIDVGSGAGFPGMVLAICGFSNVTLCDSNHKKCLFLSEVARYTDTKVHIINDRVENLQERYDLIISRACTDLDSLCRMMKILAFTQVSCGIFHKGRNWQAELDLAHENWNFIATAYPSVTSNDSVVLLIQYLASSKD